MDRYRIRIRFGKQGLLRLVGHRDLARVWERVFRRAAVAVRHSQGFHPKPRLSFPSALGMGIAGDQEILEAELSSSWSAESLRQALEPHLPLGLSLTEVETLSAESPTAQVQQVMYEFPVPLERQAELRERIAHFLGQATHLVTRGEARRSIDLRAAILELELSAGVLRMRMVVDPQGSARPREVLQALCLDDLERQGAYLTRRAVELAP